MKSINFSGAYYKEYAINGDESRVIKVNVRDAGLMSRLKTAEENLVKAAENVSEMPTVQSLEELDRVARESVDHMFGSGTSDIAFGDINCMSMNEEGEFICLAFINAIAPVLAEDISAAAQNIKAQPASFDNEKVNKYLADKPFIPLAEPAVPDVDKLTAQQKEALLRRLLS